MTSDETTSFIGTCNVRIGSPLTGTCADFAEIVAPNIQPGAVGPNRRGALTRLIVLPSLGATVEERLRERPPEAIPDELSAFLLGVDDGYYAAFRAVLTRVNEAA